jgi:hypothetical protein
MLIHLPVDKHLTALNTAAVFGKHFRSVDVYELSGSAIQFFVPSLPA